jgi:cation diffusion facilitator CzcD-associated flavoprotein CzcO
MSGVAGDGETPAGLGRLNDEVRRDFERLNHPPTNWPLPVIGPDGREALDVLVVGAGMCGQTAAFALAREGIRNVRVVDRAPRGEEGPWGTYARMETLRSPKHLTGPDLGIPSLTFRAWYEARQGRRGWDDLYKISRLDWRDYLLWVRDRIGLAVENETALTALAPVPGAPLLLRAELGGPGGRRETVFARQVVLASGRDGSGSAYVPSFPSLDRAAPKRQAGRVFHSSDPIDFAALRARRVAVLGASASAFDNAGAALEAGAASVAMYARRPFLPQVNKSRWMGFSGFQRGFAALDDATRWRFLTYAAREQTPPPHESVLRCERHHNFRLHLGEGWRDVLPEGAGSGGVTVVTAKETVRFDAVIFATGFTVDLRRRPELDAFRDAICLWRDRVSPDEATRHPELSLFPYLGPGFEFIEREPGSCPSLSRIRAFNHSATMSHSALAGDIPGLGIGAVRVAQAIGHALFIEDLDRHYADMVAFEEPELQPTSYFVPPEERERRRSAREEA